MLDAGLPNVWCHTRSAASIWSSRHLRVAAPLHRAQSVAAVDGQALLVAVVEGELCRARALDASLGAPRTFAAYRLAAAVLSHAAEDVDAGVAAVAVEGGVPGSSPGVGLERCIDKDASGRTR